MPTPGSPRRAFRLDDDELWDQFRVAADTVDSDRSAVLRDFVRWFVREKGATLPRRPASD